MAQHNKDLATLLKPTGTDNVGDVALEYYAKHTAQIEVSLPSLRNTVYYIHYLQEYLPVIGQQHCVGVGERIGEVMRYHVLLA